MIGIDAENPWPGLMAFNQEACSFFFGRRKETAEIFRLLRRDTLTVLFGQSGLGKTSLLNAGLFPLLLENNYLPVYIRLDFSDDSPDFLDQIKEAIDAATTGRRIDAPRFKGSEFERLTIWEYFHREDVDFWDRQNRLLSPTLVFDQFEEIFTLGRQGTLNVERCRVLLEELACLIDNRPPVATEARLEANLNLDKIVFVKQDYKIIFSLREDFLAELESLQNQIRAVMGNRFRLQRMNGRQAFRAVREPGREKDLVDDRVASLIVRFIASGDKTLQYGATSPDQLAQLQVEPFLLSLLCRELNIRRIALDRAQISADLLSGSREEILRNFYDQTLKAMLPQVRLLIEEHLITGSGFRDSIAREDAEAQVGVSTKDIDHLITGRLLRQEERFGVPRLELTHDILTCIVLQSRDQRREHERLAQQQQRVEELRRKARKKILLLGGMAALLIIAVISLITTLHAKKQELRHNATAIQAKDAAIKSKQREIEATRQAVFYLAEWCASRGKTECLNRDWAAALSYYQNALKQRDMANVKINALQALNRFLPEIAQYRGHTGRIQAAAFSPDGKLIASGGDDKVLRLWNVATGDSAVILEGHDDLIQAVSFSPDGQWLASGSKDGTARIWNVAQGKVAKIFSEPQGPVQATAFSPDGRWLAAATAKGSIRVRDAVSGNTVALLTGHQGRAQAVAFHPDGDLLASGGSDGTLRLWDMASRKEIARISHHEKQIHAVAFSVDGRLLASGSADKTARIYDVAQQHQIKALSQHDGTVNAVSFSPDGQTLAAATAGGDIRIWDVVSGNLIAVLSGHENSAWAVAFSPDGRLLASASWDKTVRLWSMESGRDPMVRFHRDAVYCAAFSPDGTRLASGTADGSIWIWKMDTVNKATVLAGHKQTVSAIAYSPDNRIIASAAWDKTVKLWDSKSGKLLIRLGNHDNDVYSVAFDPAGKILATASFDKKIRLWAVPSGKLLAILEGHENAVDDVVFSPDGRLLASVAWDKTIRLWDVNSGAVHRVFKPLSAEPLAAAFSPEGKFLATGGSDKNVTLWETQTGREVAILKGHEGAVNDVAFSPDGHLIASASADKTVRIWDADRKTEITTLIGHDHMVQSVSFRADGHLLASASNDKTVLLWMLGDPDRAGIMDAIGTATEAGISYAIEYSDRRIHRSHEDLTAVRLKLARQGKLFWFKDGGLHQVEFYQKNAAHQNPSTGG